MATNNYINSFGSCNKLESGSDQNGVIQPLLTGLYFIQIWGLLYIYTYTVMSLLVHFPPSSLNSKCCALALLSDR